MFTYLSYLFDILPLDDLIKSKILNKHNIKAELDERNLLNYKNIINNIKENCNLIKKECKNSIDIYLIGKLYSDNISIKEFNCIAKIDNEDNNNVIGVFFDSNKFKCFYDIDSITCEYSKIENTEIEEIVNNYKNKINIKGKEFFIYKYKEINFILTKDKLRELLQLVSFNININVKFYCTNTRNSGIIFFLDNQV